MSNRENGGQIPAGENAEQTGRVLREQESAPGQQREKTITDFPTAAALGQMLKDVNFPADKNTIARFVEQSNRSEKEDIMSVIRNIDDKQYNNVSEVAEAAGLSR
jgi:hypothetical protein